MVASLYRGFSSIAKQGLDTRLGGVNLVKQDLVNHFQTRLGERVGRPDFGSIIHDLLFDLFDDRTEGLVFADVNRVISQDPRVEPLDIQVRVSPEKQRLEVTVVLNILEFDMTENFTITFEERQ